MSSYHLSASPISRSAGHSATAAIAYRAGIAIVDERTGDSHDYTRKAGVLHSELILPDGGTADQAEFWNRIELHHKRGDAVVAREIEVSLPRELDAGARQELALAFGRKLADEFGVAADVSLHAPRTVTDYMLSKNPDLPFEIDPDTGRRHNGNWHAHIVMSGCRVSADGALGKKAVDLDPIHCARAKIQNVAERMRGPWADMQNAALSKARCFERVDHRSNLERGIAAVPGRHLGSAAAGFERRTGLSSAMRMTQERHAAEVISRAYHRGVEDRKLDKSIFDLSADLAGAIAARQHQLGEMKRRVEALVEKQAAPAPVVAVAPAPTPADLLRARVRQLLDDKPGRTYAFTPGTPGAQYSGVALLVDQAHRSVVIEHGLTLRGLTVPDTGKIAEGRMVVARADQAGKWNVALHAKEIDLDKQRDLAKSKLAAPQFSGRAMPAPPADMGPKSTLPKPEFGEVPGRRPRGPSHGR